MSQKVYEKMTNLIIKKMEEGTVPWKRPWNGKAARLGEHHNAQTGKPYRGANAILTHLTGFESPQWLTYKQAQDQGCQVRRGEIGTPILFWGSYEKKKKGQDEQAESILFVRYYTVFNAQQIEGMEDELADTQEVIQFNPIERADKLLREFADAPQIVHEKQRAYYNKIDDLINMPRKNSFHSIEEYYSTLFHELGHSTGHKSRLNRKSLNTINSFGSHSYSKEELVAEISSAFLCSMASISEKTIDNQAAYIEGWLEVLKKDSRLFVQAAQQAQKAVDYITNL